MSWRLRSRLVIELVEGLDSDWFKEDSSLNSKEVESVDEILFFFLLLLVSPPQENNRNIRSGERIKNVFFILLYLCIINTLNIIKIPMRNYSLFINAGVTSSSFLVFVITLYWMENS